MIADGSKQRIRINQKMSKSKQTIVDRLKDYNALLPEAATSREQASLEEVLDGRFPWFGEAAAGWSVPILCSVMNELFML